MKATKTNVLILIVALFLLLFPLFATSFKLPPPSLTGTTPVYSVDIYFNGHVRDGLTASTGSEEFKQYFIENLSAIDSEFPEVGLTLDHWSSYNYSRIDIEWIYELNNDEEKAEVGERLTEKFSSQWYTEATDYVVVIGDAANPTPGAIYRCCWSILCIFIISLWWSSTKNEAKRTEGKENIMEDKT